MPWASIEAENIKTVTLNRESYEQKRSILLTKIRKLRTELAETEAEFDKIVKVLRY